MSGLLKRPARGFKIFKSGLLGTDRARQNYSVRVQLFLLSYNCTRSTLFYEELILLVHDSLSINHHSCRRARRPSQAKHSVITRMHGHMWLHHPIKDYFEDPPDEPLLSVICFWLFDCCVCGCRRVTVIVHCCLRRSLAFHRESPDYEYSEYQ